MAAFLGVVVGVTVPVLLGVPAGRWMASVLADAILGDRWSV
ncbi:hypothetical protein [Cupriavidus sp. RAF20_2]